MIAVGREQKEQMERHFSGSPIELTGKGESERRRSRMTPCFKPGDLGKRQYKWKKGDNFRFRYIEFEVMDIN